MAKSGQWGQRRTAHKAYGGFSGDRTWTEEDSLYRDWPIPTTLLPYNQPGAVGAIGSLSLFGTAGAAGVASAASGSMALAATAAAKGAGTGITGSMSLSASAGAQAALVTDYDALVQTSTPWGAWNPQEPSGATIADDGGQNHPMTITGAPTNYGVAGPIDGMYGDDWPATITDFASTAAVIGTLPGTGAWALEAWFFMSAFPAAQVNIHGWAVSSSVYSNISLLANGTARVNVNSVGGVFKTTAVLSTGVWHHLVLQYNNGNFYYLLDRVSSGVPQAKSAAATGGTLYIHGGQSNGAGAVTIGPTAFYDHAVTDAEFQAHYDAGTIPPSGSVLGSLTLGGTAAATAGAFPIPATSGSLTLSGTAGAAAATPAAGAMSLAGSSGAQVVAAGTGSITLAGTAAGGIGVVASGSMTLAGATAGVGGAVASGSLVLGGVSVQSTTGIVGALTLSGTATATVSTLASATGSIVLTMGPVTANVVVAVAGSLLLSSTADAGVRGVSSGALVLTGSAGSSVPVAATGNVVLGGVAGTRAPVAADGSISLAASAGARGPIGSATGSISLSSDVFAAAGVTSVGSLTLNAQVPTLPIEVTATGLLSVLMSASAGIGVDAHGTLSLGVVHPVIIGGYNGIGILGYYTDEPEDPYIPLSLLGLRLEGDGRHDSHAEMRPVAVR